MSTWREIDRIRKSPDKFRELARQLLASAELTEWESTFCESIALKTELEEFSVRQSEKLLQIRDEADFVKTIRGFSIKVLVEKCYEARLDLSEDDEQWLTASRARDPVSMRRKHAWRLLQCASQLGLIDPVTA